MVLAVRLTADAERDLEEIVDFIEGREGAAKAGRVLDRLEQALGKLATHPDRGSFPKELLALGIREYRQTFFKPYRLIYRVLGQQVVVYLVADGRRDMQTLLTRRLLGA